MSAELDKWRAFADRRISPIEAIKEEIRAVREDLDQKFPAWKAAYNTNPQDYMSHDARREYFVSLRVILQNAQLGFIYIRDHLTQQDWWQAKVGEFRESAVLQTLREHALMVKFFSFHATAVATEETCRAIVRADPSRFGVDPSGTLYGIYPRLLKLSGCRQYGDLFEVLRLTRNTIHTNGVYRPEKPKNKTITFGGRTFTFEVGKILSWMGDDFPEWIAREVSLSMQCIVTSSIVAQVALCPRGN